MDQTRMHTSIARTWLWLGIMLSIILFKGLLSFFMVSDMGQPTWDYRTISDLPASSPYAVYPLLPNQQHVRGNKGE
jgi:hypothetical protein